MVENSIPVPRGRFAGKNGFALEVCATQNAENRAVRLIAGRDNTSIQDYPN